MHEEENVNTGTPQQTQQINSNVVRFQEFWKKFYRNKSALIGGLLIVLLNIK